MLFTFSPEAEGFCKFVYSPSCLVMLGVQTGGGCETLGECCCCCRNPGKRFYLEDPMFSVIAQLLLSPLKEHFPSGLISFDS